MKFSKKYRATIKDGLIVWNTALAKGFRSKKEAKSALSNSISSLKEKQELLYASNTSAVLLVFQGMDAGGKDSTIKQVMSGINPQGCKVTSFKRPTAEELAHDFLWRHQVALPERGMLGIFNRSHYENVLVSKVHPELVLNERLPYIESLDHINSNFWNDRYKKIRHFERDLVLSGTLVLKFFLNISKDEQCRRFLERLNNPNKHWKFERSDLIERQYWDCYQSAYKCAIESTNTDLAPWFVIPADNKWNARVIVSRIISEQLKKLDLNFPVVTDEKKKLINAARLALGKEF